VTEGTPVSALDREGATRSGFGRDHLPLGVVRPPGAAPRCAVRYGDRALDLPALVRARLVQADPALVTAPALNELLAGRDLDQLRADLQGLLDREVPLPADAVHDLADVVVGLPVAVADYVDFYSSEAHATRVGRLFRPDGDPLPEAWRHLPIGYHGRSGTVVASGTPIRRPAGQRRGADGPEHGPTRQLDYELELGVVVGRPSPPGRPVAVAEAPEHVAGIVLVNDWSARDVQAWEYRPLGPLLGKSFATSIGCWVTPLAALEPFRVPGPPQSPAVLPTLAREGRWGLDLQLEVALRSARMVRAGAPPDVVARADAAELYWTFPQQLAHLTANGAHLRTGDLCASGTISGRGDGAAGCLLEATQAGRQPLVLADGTEQTWLADGDEVTLRATAGGGAVRLAEVVGVVEPARS
jgi:fumarylacetoacetase